MIVYILIAIAIIAIIFVFFYTLNKTPTPRPTPDPTPEPVIPRGIALWATKLSGIGSDVPVSMTVDPSGNSYITGTFENDITIYNYESDSGGPITLTTFGTLTHLGEPDVLDTFIVKYNENGTALWATRLSGIGPDKPVFMKVDSSGNSYITGTFSSDMDVYSYGSVSEEGVINLTLLGTLLHSGTTDNIFIVKYDINGIALWATKLSGSGVGIDAPVSIEVDSLGNNIYITGSFTSNPLTINSYEPGGEGAINLTPFGTLPNSGGSDTFIVKYDKDGVARWATKLSGLSYDEPVSMIVDSSDNINITGTFYDPLTVYSYGSRTGETISLTDFGILPNSQPDTLDTFIVKYDKDGTTLWATKLSGIGPDSVFSMSVDLSGNSYITGIFYNAPMTVYSFVSRDGGGGTINLTPFGTLDNSGEADTFIVKYNALGAASWATKLSGSGTDTPTSTTVDSSGNSYITGTFTSNITVNSFGSRNGGTINLTPFGTLDNSGEADIFIVKYNALGAASWATKLSGSGTDVPTSVSVDLSGNSYITGNFYNNSLTVNSFVSNGGGGTINLTPFGTLDNSGETDTFIVKYNALGAASWATKLSGLSDDVSTSMSVDSLGNSYITGTFGTGLLNVNSFGSSNGGTINLTPFGTLDNLEESNAIFIVKYKN
jgi:hypothetical protein